MDSAQMPPVQFVRMMEIPVLGVSMNHWHQNRIVNVKNLKKCIKIIIPKKINKVVELVGGGSVMNGAYPV